MIECLENLEVQYVTGGKRLISKKKKKKIEKKTREIIKDAAVVATTLYINPVAGVVVDFVVND